MPRMGTCQGCEHATDGKDGKDGNMPRMATFICPCACPWACTRTYSESAECALRDRHVRVPSHHRLAVRRQKGRGRQPSGQGEALPIGTPLRGLKLPNWSPPVVDRVTRPVEQPPPFPQPRPVVVGGQPAGGVRPVRPKVGDAQCENVLPFLGGKVGHDLVGESHLDLRARALKAMDRV